MPILTILQLISYALHILSLLLELYQKLSQLIDTYLLKCNFHTVATGEAANKISTDFQHCLYGALVTDEPLDLISIKFQSYFLLGLTTRLFS